MKLITVIAFMVAFSMFIGLGSIRIQAETKSEKITELESITDPNIVFNPESIEKKWNEVKKNLVVEPDIKSITRTNGNTVSPSLWDDLPSGPMGVYPTRKGVILVTADAWKGVVPLGHAAIIYSATDVVESLSQGVVIGRNNWNTTKETCYGVSVRTTSVAQDERAAEYCFGQIGKPYNYNYFNMGTREKFYCSHLVWAAFKDLYGIDLNTYEADLIVGNTPIVTAIHPVELVSQDLTYTLYAK